MERGSVRFGMLALSLVLLALFAWIGLAYLFTREFRQGLGEDVFSPYERDARTHVDAWIEDALWLEHVEATTFRSSGRDAGEYLNPRLAWTGTGVEEWRAGSPSEAHEELSFPQTSRSHLRESWPQVSLDELELGDADVSWLHSILEYHRWDLDHGTPPGWTNLSYDAPTPDLVALLLWSEVRLLQAARDHSEGQAIEEVRHLARLLLTTKHGMAILLASQLIALEKDLTETLGWTVPPLPPDLIALANSARIERLMRAASCVLNLASPDDVFEKATAKTNGTVAFCAALEDAVQQAAGLAPIAEGTPTYGQRYIRLRALSQEADCNKERLDQLWVLAEDDSLRVLAVAFSPFQRLMMRIAFIVPSTRDAAGEIFMSLWLIRGFSGYEEASPAETAEPPE